MILFLDHRSKRKAEMQLLWADRPVYLGKEEKQQRIMVPG